jgi:peptide/nickel transport system permease protein
MLRYLIGRLVIFVPTLLIVALLVSILVRLVPGNPVSLMLGLDASEESVEEARVNLGLDQPLPAWIVHWFEHALTGDLGNSIFLKQSVASLIVERYPVTINLTLLSLLISLIVGIPAGVIAGVRQGSKTDWAAMMASLLVLSAPGFWLGLNLIYFFGVKLGWFPVGGYVPLTKNPLDFLKHMALPAISLGLGNAALIARMARSSMLEVLHMDYVRTARAKGLREQVVIIRHAFRNTLVPVLTVIGLAVGILLGGSVITETVFNLPGVGRLVVEAVMRRDYAVVQGVVLAITATFLVINLFVDVLYLWVDPRIRYQ